METEVIDVAAFSPGDFVKFSPSSEWIETTNLRGKVFVALVIGQHHGHPILRVFNPYSVAEQPKRAPGALKVGTPTGFSFSIEPGQKLSSSGDPTVWFDGSQGKVESL